MLADNFKLRHDRVELRIAPVRPKVFENKIAEYYRVNSLSRYAENVASVFVSYSRLHLS
jgi:hypothetical protein